MKLEFILNGDRVSTDCAAGDSLLTVLRSLNCYSVRSGCETGNCGICTVWVDAVPVLSCSYPAQRAAGKRVTTLEGVREEANGFMELLAAEGADQCGYCSPGFIMTVLAMVRELRDPTDEEIGRYLSGNLCRCTGYTSQMRAIRKLYASRQVKTDE